MVSVAGVGVVEYGTNARCAAVVDRGIAVNGRTEVSVKSDGCAGGYGSDVRRVEHVQAVVTVTSSRRGHVELYLTSPGGTRSTLLAGRRGKNNN